MCQEALAWEGYYPEGPIDFQTETLGILVEICDAVPEEIDFGYHLCYGSPADAHIVLPTDSGVMVDMANAVARRVHRSIEYFHMPVMQDRRDDAYFEPMKGLNLNPDTALYLGLIHREDHAQVMRPGSWPPAGTRRSMASALNAVWCVATRRSFRPCWQTTRSPQILEFDSLVRSSAHGIPETFQTVGAGIYQHGAHRPSAGHPMPRRKTNTRPGRREL